MEIEVIDNYTHLSFREPENLNDLKVGMMVQIVKTDNCPFAWEWYEVDNELISYLKYRGGLWWVRVLDEPIRDYIMTEKHKKCVEIMQSLQHIHGKITDYFGNEFVDIEKMSDEDRVMVSIYTTLQLAMNWDDELPGLT